MYLLFQATKINMSQGDKDFETLKENQETENRISFIHTYINREIAILLVIMMIYENKFDNWEI